MMTDPIADMLTRIRNASSVRKKEVVLPFSKLKMSIAEILAREGYLGKVEATKDKKPQIVLTLRYEGREPVINSLRRVSTPGHRKYVKSADLSKVLNGFGLSILSTPVGMMSNLEAKKAKVGGEIICEVY